MPYTYPITIHHLYISPGHNYFGNKGETPGLHPTYDVAAVAVKAGAGLVGDTADPLCRAAQWRRLSRRADHPVYRLCGPDIVRGSLRLWRHSAEGVR